MKVIDKPTFKRPENLYKRPIRLILLSSKYTRLAYIFNIEYRKQCFQKTYPLSSKFNKF